MMTMRARMFLVAAATFYLFANQTQVGWLYVMSAVLAGVVLAGWWLNRGTLRPITATRKLSAAADAELYEGDPLNIELTLQTKGSTNISQMRLTETCPLTAPDDPSREMKLFIPTLPVHEAVQFDYDVTLYRRGVYEFPSLELNSQAPFGFFKQKRKLQVETSLLVYPEVRRLRYLELLDRQLAPQLPRQKAGTGYEVIGVRPFRSGDSPRHIHWRSVARTGHLISKEFADEAQPGLSIMLDLFAHPYPQTESKHTPFEWAIKCATSIADYAQGRGYPVHLLADEDVLPVPVSPVSRWAMLQYLAKVQPSGQRRLDSLLGRQPIQTFAAVLLPYPDRAAVAPLLDLHHRRVEVLAVVIEPESFPEPGQSAAALVDELTSLGIATRHVKFTENTTEDWAIQLSELPERVRA